MFSESERKFVQVIHEEAWHVALGDIFERFHGHESWGLHARIVDKSTAAQFLAKGMIRVQCNDNDIRVNLRQRHKEAYMLPDELPEKCGPKDSILLVRKRQPGDPAQPGFDNRYHFFLVTWADPELLRAEFANQGIPSDAEEVETAGQATDVTNAAKATKASSCNQANRSNQANRNNQSKRNKRQTRKKCTHKVETPEPISNFHSGPPRRRGFRKGLSVARTTHRWRF